MAEGLSGWTLAREILQTVVTLIFIPLAFGGAVWRMMIAKIFAAKFFDVHKGTATKDPLASKPTIEIRIPLRLHCRVEPGVDSLYVEAFGSRLSPSSNMVIERYAAGYSFQMPKGKSVKFELRVIAGELDRRVVEKWTGGYVTLVMEHGWRKGKFAIRKNVNVALASQ